MQSVASFRHFLPAKDSSWTKTEYHTRQWGLLITPLALPAPQGMNNRYSYPVNRDLASLYYYVYNVVSWTVCTPRDSPPRLRYLNF